MQDQKWKEGGGERIHPSPQGQSPLAHDRFKDKYMT